ncbi:hypothetical protein BGI34_01370 [Snodgrassella alvi]|nr:hypothetical protein BGI34_01370 [Snodgrassella alvi]
MAESNTGEKIFPKADYFGTQFSGTQYRCCYGNYQVDGMFAAFDFAHDNGFTTDAHVVGNSDATFAVVGDFGFAGAAVVAAYGRLAVDVDFAGTFGHVFGTTG